jgi:Heterokaryon incompatibility protein (HET)
MVTVEVEKAPPYAALSYTWGSKTLERVLNVNGHDIAITKNLSEAIDALFAFVRGRNLLFWADSVCINQTDLRERSMQVQLMSTIYRAAELVLVWLGPAENDSDFGFDKLRVWESRLDEIKKQTGGSDDLAVSSIAVNDPLFFGAHGSEAHRIQEAFRSICRRTWWRRAWIVQEGTMTSSSRTLLCTGNRMMNWNCLRAALKIAQHVGRYQKEEMKMDFDETMALRLDLFREKRETGCMIRLLEVLALMRAYECEDFRDKIYASLGMAMDMKEDDIIPDYTKSCSKVFYDVVRFCVASSSQSLDFLGYVLRSEEGSLFEYETDSTLPSWVPDWRARGSFYPFEKNLHEIGFAREDVYNAGGPFRGECRIESAQLILHGSSLDRITKVWQVCQWNLVEWGLNCERSWMPTEPDSDYATGGTMLEAFNHTLLADVGRKGYENDSGFARGYAVDWSLVDMNEQEMTADDRHRRSWILADTKAMTFGRRLFQTERGYIGLGPAACRLNDRVCVLFGGQVLYLLREQDVNHEFIGECYVHGMMDGQAVQAELLSEKVFTLV